MICECSAGAGSLVERCPGRDLLPKAKASRFDDWPHLNQKRSTSFVRPKLKDHLEDNRPVLRIWIALQDFAAFNKGQIAIQFSLKKELMFNAVGPVQVVTNGKSDVPSDPVGTDDVNFIRLLYRHSITSAFSKKKPKNEAPPGGTFFLGFFGFMNS